MSKRRKGAGRRSPTLMVLVLLLAMVLTASIASLAMAGESAGGPTETIRSPGGKDGRCYPNTTWPTFMTTTTTAPTTTTTAPTTTTTAPTTTTTAPTTSSTESPSTVTAIETGGGGTAGAGTGHWALAALAGALGVGFVTSTVRVRRKAK